MRHVALVATGVLLAGCTVGPDYRRPAVQTPTDFRGAITPAAEPALGDLVPRPWRASGGPVLA
jgi:hypothetical protein